MLGDATFNREPFDSSLHRPRLRITLESGRARRRYAVAEQALMTFEKRRRGFPVFTDTTFPLIFQTFTRGSNSEIAMGGFRVAMIIRARHDKNDPYFRFRRATAQDVRLSWAARGLLAYLFSKPDNWEVSPAALMKEGDLKRDALYRVIAELKTHGYVDRYQERREDGSLGRWITDVYEVPNLDKDSTPLPGLPDPVEPLPAEPDPVQPEAVKTDTTYKREVHNREYTHKQQQHIEADGKRGDKTAAAAGRMDKESSASRFPLDQIDAFIRATKPHKTENQIGGLARHLQRTGEEDELIAEWLDRQALASARVEHSPECALCQGTGWQVIQGQGARPCPNLSIAKNSPST